jgi:hypothetical protein
VSRHLFLIALLSVLLPGGLLPQELSQDRTADAARPFVVALRAMPGAARAASRTMRKSVVARPVRGVYMIPSRQPKALSALRPADPLPDRLLWRPSSLRAPPALA